jgi:hypothetical protein
LHRSDDKLFHPVSTFGLKRNGSVRRIVEDMKASDWIIDIALILIVFRQLREERLTLRTILLPAALMS